MKGKSSDNNEELIFNIAGDLVALGPLRRDLLPPYQRWVNDLGTMRTLGLAPLPMTNEKEQDWYERQSKTEDDTPFTIYERETLRPIGNTGLHGVDLRNRSATFGILIGEPECRGKGYGTETTRLMLDYAFTALGLHNVMLTVFEFNPAGTGFQFCKRRWNHISGHLQIAGRCQVRPQAHSPVHLVPFFGGRSAGFSGMAPAYSSSKTLRSCSSRSRCSVRWRDASRVRSVSRRSSSIAAKRSRSSSKSMSPVAAIS